jgi:hypothetical protein
MRSEFSIIVYGGEEYYISVDGHRKLGDIRLRVFEKDDKNALLYDNSEFNYEEFFYFKNSETRNLIVEVKAEEAEDPEEAAEKYCLGVLIEFRDINKSQKDSLGF